MPARGAKASKAFLETVDKLLGDKVRGRDAPKDASGLRGIGVLAAMRGQRHAAAARESKHTEHRIRVGGYTEDESGATFAPVAAGSGAFDLDAELRSMFRMYDFNKAPAAGVGGGAGVAGADSSSSSGSHGDGGAADSAALVRRRVGLRQVRTSEYRATFAPLVALQPRRIFRPSERMMDEAVWKAFQLGQFADVFRALAQGADVNFQRSKADLTTALMAAAYHGQARVVVALLRQDALVRVTDAHGANAAALAERRGHPELARFLRDVLVEEREEAVRWENCDFPGEEDHGVAAREAAAAGGGGYGSGGDGSTAAIVPSGGTSTQTEQLTAALAASGGLTTAALAALKKAKEEAAAAATSRAEVEAQGHGAQRGEDAEDGEEEMYDFFVAEAAPTAAAGVGAAEGASAALDAAAPVYAATAASATSGHAASPVMAEDEASPPSGPATTFAAAGSGGTHRMAVESGLYAELSGYLRGGSSGGRRRSAAAVAARRRAGAVPRVTRNTAVTSAAGQDQAQAPADGSDDDDDGSDVPSDSEWLENEAQEAEDADDSDRDSADSNAEGHYTHEYPEEGLRGGAGSDEDDVDDDEEDDEEDSDSAGSDSDGSGGGGRSANERIRAAKRALRRNRRGRRARAGEEAGWAAGRLTDAEDSELTASLLRYAAEAAEVPVLPSGQQPMFASPSFAPLSAEGGAAAAEGSWSRVDYARSTGASGSAPAAAASVGYPIASASAPDAMATDAPAFAAESSVPVSTASAAHARRFASANAGEMGAGGDAAGGRDSSRSGRVRFAPDSKPDASAPLSGFATGPGLRGASLPQARRASRFAMFVSKEAGGEAAGASSATAALHSGAAGDGASESKEGAEGSANRRGHGFVTLDDLPAFHPARDPRADPEEVREYLQFLRERKAAGFALPSAARL
jgi:hypothetical protein